MKFRQFPTYNQEGVQYNLLCDKDLQEGVLEIPSCTMNNPVGFKNTLLMKVVSGLDNSVNTTFT